jgi:hypothetical protein
MERAVLALDSGQLKLGENLLPPEYRMSANIEAYLRLTRRLA